LAILRSTRRFGALAFEQTGIDHRQERLSLSRELGHCVERHFITRAHPLTTTFLDYLIPTTTDIPVFEIGHMETPASGPGGYKGVGEGGAIGAVPAVRNAISDALAQAGSPGITGPVRPCDVHDLRGLQV